MAAGVSFTGFAVLDDQTNTSSTLKVFSRPDAPGEEILLALETLAARDIVYFTHGTTVGVNTVIQRNGHDIALFTTRNFEDVLEVPRLKMPQIHNLYSVRPVPFINRERVLGIPERTLATGIVQTTPQEDDVECAVDAAHAAGCKGIVLSFLSSYRKPKNEQAVAAMIAKIASYLLVVSSVESWPVIREFERIITAIISGYVQPRLVSLLRPF